MLESGTDNLEGVILAAGQGTRMNAQVAAFKPSLGSQLCESVKPVPALSPRGLVIALVLLAATLAAVRRVATR